MKKTILSLLGLLLIFGATMLRAQDTAPASEAKDATWPRNFTFGLGAGINMNFAAGNYLIDSNTYSSGFGVAPVFHLLLEIPLAEHWMLAPRVGYSDRSAAFTDGKLTTPGVGMEERNFAYTLQMFGLDINAKYVINNLHILAGPSFNSAIKKTYALGTSSQASSSSKELPGASSFFMSIGAGAGYDIPINKQNSVWLSPEVFYSFPLTDMAGDNNGSLKISSLRAALTVKFDLGKKEEAPPPPPETPIEVGISSKGILPNGDQTNEPIIPEQATRSRNSMPLLPYVFFDYNKDNIPDRYNTSASTGFTVESLAGKSELEVNHNVLNVYGQRMKQNPKMKLKVTGTNSNSGEERNNIQLSRRRAMAVRDYLVNTWGISGDRIVVDARNLPELPTNPVTKAGMEENRRVEITSEDVSMNEPVKIENKKSEAIGETLIRFETNLRNGEKANITSWKITLDQNGMPIGSGQSGNGTPPHTLTMSVPDAMNYQGQPVHYQMEITDANGKTYKGDGMTRIVRKTVEHDNLEKYAMLSFDFDKSEVNDRAKAMIGLIGESITKDASGVTIKGYCDVTGAVDYNQALSEARAAEAAKALRAVTKLPANTTVNGFGKNNFKFENELPEGRMLNRRVEVDIQKSNR
jgi:outer membrane protein OmpA-like peptidoglycan-associated protein